MAFIGFDFRSSQNGGANLPADNNNDTAILSGATYAAGSTPGYIAGGGYPSAYSDAANASDRRLGGAHGISGLPIMFKVDVPNGDYDIRLGASQPGTANIMGARVYFGSNNSTDYIDITSHDGNGANAGVPVGSEMDATGAILTNANWISQYAGTSTAGTKRITVKDNAGIRIGKNSTANLQLRHFAYQAIVAPLTDTRLDSDDTGFVISTSGTTTAGSASVAGLPSAVGIWPGMTVTGPAVPAGVTVQSIGTMDTTGAITSLTLSSGTGVTALASGSLRFGWPPALYEKQPAGKLICPVTIASGASSLAVFMADGTTPHPHLGVKLADPANTGTPVPFLYHTTSTFPGIASTHTFVIAQTDNSGTFTGSPHATTFTLPVTFAPSKPTTGLLSSISTGAYLLRKKILDTMNADRWPGYRGQAFALEATAKSLSELFSALTTLASGAGGGRWYRIRLINGPGSDWATAFNAPTTTWNFLPELGGGCLIEPDAGVNISISGPIVTGDQRGVHVRNLTFVYEGPVSGGYYPYRVGHQNGKPFTVLMVTGNKCGFLQNPAYTDGSLGANVAKSQNMFFVQWADQFTAIGNDFYGCADCLIAQGVRRFESAWNSFRRLTGDCHAPSGFGLSDAITDAYQGASGNQDNYWHVHDNITYANEDIPSSYLYNATASTTGNLTSGSTSVTGIPNIASFDLPQRIGGVGIPDGTTVVSITKDGSNTVTGLVMSAAATATATGSALRIATGTWGAAHGDFIQVRPTKSQPTFIFRVLENNVMSCNVQNYTTDQSSTSKAKTFRDTNARQFAIDSSGDSGFPATLYDVVINNVSAAPLGLGLHCGLGELYAECNTWVGPSRMPPSGSGAQLGTGSSVTPLQTILGQPARGWRHRSRKNILRDAGYNSVARSLATEDDKFVVMGSNSINAKGDPNALMKGTLNRPGFVGGPNS